MNQTITEAELKQIEEYLSSEGGREQLNPMVQHWLRLLLAEVRQLRAAAGHAPEAAPGEEPLKRHGDALLDGSGSRHGADAG